MNFKNLLLFAILFASITATFAQRKIKVEERNESFLNGNHNSLVVNIYEANQDLIEKEWKKFMKDYNAKVSTKKEVFADDAMIKELSPNTVDVYARVEKNSEGDFNLIVAIDLGGIYLSSSTNSDKYNVAEELVYKFAVQTTKEAIKGQIKSENNILDDLIKSSENLVRENENLKKDIEDYETKILRAQDNIKLNDQSQVRLGEEIEKQRMVVKQIEEKQESVK
jgi:hypothetical protein